MAVNAISIEEAFAQGSTWRQIASIAAFRRSRISLVRQNDLDPQRLSKLSRMAATIATDEAKRAIRAHQDAAEYFDRMAVRMKAIAEDEGDVDEGR